MSWFGLGSPSPPKKKKVSAARDEDGGLILHGANNKHRIRKRLACGGRCVDKRTAASPVAAAAPTTASPQSGDFSGGGGGSSSYSGGSFRQAGRDPMSISTDGTTYPIEEESGVEEMFEQFPPSSRSFGSLGAAGGPGLATIPSGTVLMHNELRQAGPRTFVKEQAVMKRPLDGDEEVDTIAMQREVVKVPGSDRGDSPVPEINTFRSWWSAFFSPNEKAAASPSTSTSQYSPSPSGAIGGAEVYGSIPSERAGSQFGLPRPIEPKTSLDDVHSPPGNNLVVKEEVLVEVPHGEEDAEGQVWWHRTVHQGNHLVDKTIGKDGNLTTSAEHLPVVNNFMWAWHKIRGHDEQAMRASGSNPLGTDGYVTRTAECVPGISDALRAVHTFTGHEDAAERARGNSLAKHFGKGGAIIKTAELLPGSNLVAALLMEARGDHEEAKKALNLLENWRQVGSPDGALAKLAEAFPGTDLVAFGIHCNNGDFGQAIRSISKARTVEVTATRLLAAWEVGTVGSFKMVVLDVSRLDAYNVAAPLYGALLDVVSHLLEANAEGKQSMLHQIAQTCGSSHFGDRVCEIVTTSAQATIAAQLEALPNTISDALRGANKSLLEKRLQSFVYANILPPRIPNPRNDLVETVRELVPKVTVTHLPLPPILQHRAKYKENFKSATPEAAAAVSCLAFTGCIGFGFHTGLLGCLAGCFAGATQGLRHLSANFVPKLNKHNEEVWAAVEKRPVLPREDSQGSVQTVFDRKNHSGVVVEVPDSERLLDVLTQYIEDKLLAMWALGRAGRKLLRFVLPPLRRFLADLILDEYAGGKPQGAPVQLTLHIEVPHQHLEVTKLDVLEVPAFPLAVVMDLQLAGDGPLLTRTRVVLPDLVLGNVLETVADQLRNLDLRHVDPRMHSFVEPLKAKFDLDFCWKTPTCPQLVINDFKLKMALPV
mmetsp:Transcript_74363/g.162628  ORF Transcript_74363/g.162628 Transcript_74363/m.162628 type:complete len:936 (+) Transcript_74363:269-3076(+)